MVVLEAIQIFYPGNHLLFYRASCFRFGSGIAGLYGCCSYDPFYSSENSAFWRSDERCLFFAFYDSDGRRASALLHRGLGAVPCQDLSGSQKTTYLHNFGDK